MFTVPFRKMHGLGNDFVVLDARGPSPEAAALRALSPEAAALLADRRRGIGCDQLIVVEPARSASGTAFMRIRNPDGGEAEACGNATRCVAALLSDETGAAETVVETVAGTLPARRAPDGTVTVDMGPASDAWDRIPLARAVDTASLPVSVGPLDAPVGVGVGNPHAVFFVDDADAVDLETHGPVVEHHPLFPARTNVEVVSALPARDDGVPRLRMRVWERSAGITQACGSGACAVAAAAVRRGIVAGGRIEVVLDGGALEMTVRADGHVLMSGPTALAFTGSVAIPEAADAAAAE